jgi:hypothetical protein
MAGALGWDHERTRREAVGWRARLAAAHAAELEPDDERGLAAYRGALAERLDAPVRQ